MLYIYVHMLYFLYLYIHTYIYLLLGIGSRSYARLGSHMIDSRIENLNEHVSIKLNQQLQNFPQRKQQAPITLQFLLYTHDSSISYLIQALPENRKRFLAVYPNVFSSSSQAKR